MANLSRIQRAQAGTCLFSAACRKLIKRSFPGSFCDTWQVVGQAADDEEAGSPVLPAKRVHYPDATRVKISSVSSMFFEMSNCAAHWIFVVLAAARREGSDQRRIASRKARRSPV